MSRKADARSAGADAESPDATAPAGEPASNPSDSPPPSPGQRPKVVRQYGQPAGPPPPSDNNRRISKRFDFHSPVALVLLESNGSRRTPLVLTAEDIGSGGLCVRSSFMIHPGSIGAVQMMRAGGTTMTQGVVVRWCHYAGQMKHLIGLKFQTPHPSITPTDFHDEQGRPALLNPRWLRLWGQSDEAA